MYKWHDISHPTTRHSKDSPMTLQRSLIYLWVWKFLIDTCRYYRAPDGANRNIVDEWLSRWWMTQFASPGWRGSVTSSTWGQSPGTSSYLASGNLKLAFKQAQKGSCELLTLIALKASQLYKATSRAASLLIKLLTSTGLGLDISSCCNNSCLRSLLIVSIMSTLIFVIDQDYTHLSVYQSCYSGNHVN